MSFIQNLFGGIAAGSEHIKVLSAQEFHDQTAGKKVQLIDVRTKGEFQSGHIKNARNIDVQSGNFSAQAETLKKREPVYLYCRSGARSRSAAASLVRMGFEEIYDLRGGIMSWPY